MNDLNGFVLTCVVASLLAVGIMALVHVARPLPCVDVTAQGGTGWLNH